MREAEQTLADPPRSGSRRLRSEEATGWVSGHLLTIGVSGWSVEIADGLAANASVNGSFGGCGFGVPEPSPTR